MTRHFPPPDRQAITPASILIDAARCWRQARDNGESVQPCLARALDLHGCPMLAPVFDSLFRFYEHALGRPMAVGDVMTLSGDERLVLGLLDGWCARACVNCPQNATHLLNCALRSTRIMLMLTLDPLASGFPERPDRLHRRAGE
jgi:hypothetical protein